MMMASLSVAGAGLITVDFPDERITGADMEWNFLDLRDRSFYRLLVQAKRAYVRGKAWGSHEYQEVLKIAPTLDELQATVLCETARQQPGTYPLYAFYHAGQTCEGARADGKSLAGVCLADGYAIEKRVRKATTKEGKKDAKRVGRVLPLLFPLTGLFCPPSFVELPILGWDDARPSVPFVIVGRQLGVPIPPTPREVRARLVQQRTALAEIAVVAELPQIPEVVTGTSLNILRYEPGQLRTRRVNFVIR